MGIAACTVSQDKTIAIGGFGSVQKSNDVGINSAAGEFAWGTQAIILNGPCGLLIAGSQTSESVSYTFTI